MNLKDYNICGSCEWIYKKTESEGCPKCGFGYYKLEDVYPDITKFYLKKQIFYYKNCCLSDKKGRDKLKKLYRYSDTWRKSDYELDTFYVIDETDFTYLVVSDKFYDTLEPFKRVYKNANKPYAYETKEQALLSYYYRKDKHLCILNDKIYNVKKRLEKCEKELEKLEMFNIKKGLLYV